MPQLLSVSRAARLVGTTRAALQRQIRDSALHTFEGKIALTDLLRLYPQVKMEDSRMLEKVARIKAHATPGSREQVALPTAEVLAGRITGLSHELGESKHLLRHYVLCAGQLQEKLRALQACENEHILRRELEAMAAWVESEMQRKPEMEDARVRLLAKDSFLRVMAAHVKVIPSGHDFFVDGANSLLDAALRAGLRVNYGCSNGNCGACKARVISGEVHKLREYEYPFSETERSLGYILLCSYTAVTDLTLEAAEASCVADLPLQHINAKISKCDVLNEEICLVQVRTPRTKTLRFMAGQMVRLQVDGVQGDYYPASCPCDGGNVQFHIHRHSSALATVLFASTQEPRTLSIDGPQGCFVLAEESHDPLLLLAWEEGFAPLRSIIEHAISMDTVDSFQLEWFSSSANGHYQENQCRAWSDALDNFNYHLTQCATATLSTALHTRLHSISTIQHCQIYLAGPEFFIAQAQSALAALGVAANHIHAGMVTRHVIDF
jgi:CDP-4-dehydro-6-deoxyglucose reductase, E3